MKPSQILDSNELKLPFGKDKVINAGRYLRAYNLYKSGKKGSNEQVTINEFVILLYCLSAGITDAKTKSVLYNLIYLKSKKEGLFFNRMINLFTKGSLKEISKVEISQTFPFAHIYHESGEVEEYFIYDQEYKNLLQQVTILPNRYMKQLKFHVHQTTNIGSQMLHESDYQKMIQEGHEDTKQIESNSPTIADIKKAIGAK
jgi:hypothetical protein